MDDALRDHHPISSSLARSTLTPCRFTTFFLQGTQGPTEPILRKPAVITCCTVKFIGKGDLRSNLRWGITQNQLLPLRRIDVRLWIVYRFAYPQIDTTTLSSDQSAQRTGKLDSQIYVTVDAMTGIVVLRGANCDTAIIGSVIYASLT